MAMARARARVRARPRNKKHCYMKRDFSQYSWSSITLNRKLKFFNIYCHDKNFTVDEVTKAIKNHALALFCDTLRGNRITARVLRTRLYVIRDQVYAAMPDVDPEGLENRKPILKKKK